MYSFLHNVTCFKYNAVFICKCRFDFFRICVERSTIIKHDNIEFYKNKVWINFWRSIFASLFKLNHDINFIFFNVKMFVFVKYIINDIIKKNCNQYQRIMKSTFIYKTRTDVVKNLNNESNSNNFVRRADIEKFALRAYNRLIHDREIIDFFCRKLFDRVVEILNFFLNVVRRIFAFILFSDFVDTSNEFIRFKKFKSLFKIMYNYYWWKKSFFNKYSIFDYVKYVNIINVNNQNLSTSHLTIVIHFRNLWNNDHCCHQQLILLYFCIIRYY